MSAGLLTPSGRVGPLPSLAPAEGPDAAGHRLLVAWRGSERLEDATFDRLGAYLNAGDVVVVNTSATLPAAIPAGGDLLVHLSSELDDGRWVVELRQACRAGSARHQGGSLGRRLELPGGGVAILDGAYPFGTSLPSRLWTARLDLPIPVRAYLARVGRPIRYGCPERPVPLSAYQTVFARHPGSAEMPSAARGFTHELVTELVVRGVVVVPVLLHTGVSSQERGEPPYPERFEVPGTTAEALNAARRRGSTVVAVGTTVTRALESAVDPSGKVVATRGWTDLVVTPDSGVRVVDALITGWHEPEASHLQLLEAVAGAPLVWRSYAAAHAEGYRGHEFGDFHLILP